MSNSIDSILELLTSDKEKATELKNFLGSFSENKSSNTTLPDKTQVIQDSDRLQQKINLINAMIPLLNSKSAEYAQFIIRLLSMMSAIQSLKNSQN